MRPSFTKIITSVALVFLCFNAFTQNVTLYLEDFETPGKDSRFFLSHDWNTESTTLRSYYTVGEQADFITAPTISGQTNTHFIAVEESDLGGGPTNGIVDLITEPITVDSFSQLIFSFDLAAANTNTFDAFSVGNRDFLNVDVRFDGGAWTRIMQFRNGPLASTNNQRLYQDTDFDNVGGEEGGTLIGLAMQRFIDTVTVTGSVVEYRILLRANSFNEEIFYDRLVVQGIPLNTPDANLNRMLYKYMGYTTDNLRTGLYARTHPSAVSYEFEISGAGFTTQNIVQASNSFNLKDVTGIVYGRNYDLRHRIITGGGPGVWSDLYYGMWTIKVDTATTQLRTDFCDDTVNFSTDLIYFDLVGGATNYRINATGPSSFSTTDSLNEIRSYFTLQELGATAQGTYTISVEAEVQGSFWTNPDTECTVEWISGTPAPSIEKFTCGSTLDNPNKVFYASKVAVADSFEWRLVGDGTPIGTMTFITPDRKFNPTEYVSNLGNEETYDLRVRYYTGGSNSSYSSACGFTLGTPVLQITSPSCSSTITDSTTLIKTKLVPNATYQFNVTGTGFDTSFVNSTPNMSIAQLNESEDLSSIDVRVRPVYAGDTTNTFGSFCTFTYTQARLAGGKQYKSLESVGLQANLVKIYPNPTTSIIHIENMGLKIRSYTVYNIQGKEILIQESISANHVEVDLSGVPSGQYLMRVVTDDGHSDIHRISKR